MRKLLLVLVLLSLPLVLASAPPPPEEVITLEANPFPAYVDPGGTVSVEIVADGVPNVLMYGVVGYEVRLSYNPDVLAFAGFEWGDYMDEHASIEVGPDVLPADGYVTFGQVSTLFEEVQPESDILATLTFTATRPGRSHISFVRGDTMFYRDDLTRIPLEYADAQVMVYQSCKGDFVEPFGYRDFDDVLAFLRYYSNNDRRADLNRDGVLDEADVEEMIALVWTACEAG